MKKGAIIETANAGNYMATGVAHPFEDDTILVCRLSKKGQPTTRHHYAKRVQGLGWFVLTNAKAIYLNP